MAKMDKKWVVLCSAAIGAIYAGGYFATETQATQAPLAPTQQSSQTAPAPAQAPASAKRGIAAKSIYKDGTYTGMGRNRRGSIQVAVTLKKDKITDVEISNFAMHYSERDVVGLPAEVLQIQNAEVRNVSGATYSTQAFKDAVQSALDQAKNL